MRDHEPVVSNNTPSNRGLVWGLAGGLLAALCCAGPLVAVLIGIGGATGALGLVRFKWEFLAVGFVVTAVGIGFSLRRAKTRCSVRTYRRNRILLPVVGVLVFALLAFGSQRVLLDDRVIGVASSRLSAQTGNDRQAASLAASEAHQLDVAVTSGVDCAACLLAIQQKLAETPGVASARFVTLPQADYTVRVVYDPARVTQAALVMTIAQSPGSSGGSYGTKC
jgi:copper chaperone CopZ